MAIDQLIGTTPPSTILGLKESSEIEWFSTSLLSGRNCSFLKIVFDLLHWPWKLLSTCAWFTYETYWTIVVFHSHVKLLGTYLDLRKESPETPTTNSAKKKQSIMGQLTLVGDIMWGLNWIEPFLSSNPSAQIHPQVKTPWGVKLYIINWRKCDICCTGEAHAHLDLESESSTWTKTMQS